MHLQLICVAGLNDHDMAFQFDNLRICALDFRCIASSIKAFSLPNR